MFFEGKEYFETNSFVSELRIKNEKLSIADGSSTFQG